MESTSIRRWIGTSPGRAITALTALVVVVAVAAVVARLLRDADASDARAGPVVAAVPPLASTPAARPASAAEVPLLSADPSGAEEVQVCGGAWLKTDADGRASAAEARDLGQRATFAARVQTLAAMAASGDARAQAAAHLYRLSLDRARPLCGKDGQCAPAAEGSRAPAEPELTALVQLTQGSNDPQIYAWAYRACHDPAPGAESPCQLVTVEQWSRLDPTNAMPWLNMAAEAERRGDVDGLGDAMFHVAKAERQDSGWGSLAAEVVKHAPVGDAHLNEDVNLVIEAIGIDAAAPVPYFTASKYCSSGSLADANRRETCDAIASVLLQKSNSIMDLKVSLGMARRLGWPEERITSLEDEQEALSAALGSMAPQDVDETSCKGLREALGYVRDLAAYGELAMAKRAIAASGKPLPLLAAESRRAHAEEVQKLRREEAAASAVVN